MEIIEAKQTDLDAFFDYLKLQLLDNASDDSSLFQHCQVYE